MDKWNLGKYVVAKWSWIPSLFHECSLSYLIIRLGSLYNVGLHNVQVTYPFLCLGFSSKFDCLYQSSWEVTATYYVSLPTLSMSKVTTCLVTYLGDDWCKWMFIPCKTSFPLSTYGINFQDWLIYVWYLCKLKFMFM